MRVFLGLGSNQGDRQRHLRGAIASLPFVVAVSPVYETEPLGGPSGQNKFLNLVVELASDLSPRELLVLCQGLEHTAGRVRKERWGPRTLDVDILIMDGLTVDEPDLTIPHPRMYERKFVLAPLADLAPELVPPDLLAGVEGSVDRLGRL